jgi:hypothetical protein
VGVVQGLFIHAVGVKVGISIVASCVSTYASNVCEAIKAETSSEGSAVGIIVDTSTRGVLDSLTTGVLLATCDGMDVDIEDAGELVGGEATGIFVQPAETKIVTTKKPAQKDLHKLSKKSFNKAGLPVGVRLSVIIQGLLGR